MKQEGYKADFSTAITVASSTIGAIIPPSILMIIFGSVTNVSIGKLFMGGLIPGILLGFGQMAYVLYLSRSPKYKDYIPQGEKLDRETMWRYFKEGLPTVLLPLVIIGGISSGIVTATESAALAVVIAIILGLVDFILLRGLYLIF